MVLSILDGSTLRTPHNIYVLDGSNVRRVRQITELVDDKLPRREERKSPVVICYGDC